MNTTNGPLLSYWLVVFACLFYQLHIPSIVYNQFLAGYTAHSHLLKKLGKLIILVVFFASLLIPLFIVKINESNKRKKTSLRRQAQRVVVGYMESMTTIWKIDERIEMHSKVACNKGFFNQMNFKGRFFQPTAHPGCWYFFFSLPSTIVLVNVGKQTIRWYRFERQTRKKSPIPNKSAIYWLEITTKYTLTISIVHSNFIHTIEMELNMAWIVLNGMRWHGFSFRTFL